MRPDQGDCCVTFGARMTEKVLGLMVLGLSAALVHTVSAGGSYCAKTARAQAQALGLNYPGLHGAPDLSGPPSYSAQNPSILHHQLSQTNLQSPPVNYNPFFYPPRANPRARPAAAYRSHRQNQFHALSSFSSAGPRNNQLSNFEPVMRVDPLTETQPSGRDELGRWGLNGEKRQFPFVYDGPGVAVDASVLSRNGIREVNGLPLPNIPGYGVYYMVYPAGARSAGNGGEPGWPTYGRKNGNARHPFDRRKK